MLKNLILTTLTASFLASGATIGFVPVNQNINLGNITTVDVTIGALAQGQVIGAYDLRVLYTSTIINALSISFLGGLGPVGGNLTSSSIAVAGQADAAEVSFASNATLAGLQATQPFSIFRIQFQGIGLGTSPLTFSVSPRVLSDGNGNALASTAVIASTGSITVQDGGVPEPGTWMLMASGLGLLVLSRSRN